MKKRMILFVIIMLVIIGGCNDQRSQQSGEPNRDANPSKTEHQKQVQGTNWNDSDSDGVSQNGEVDGENINNTQDDNSPEDNTDSFSNEENNTTQFTNDPNKQVWLDCYKMINITNFPYEKPNVINKRNFSENFISDKTLLNELGKEYYTIYVTPSAEYLILGLPFEYTKYSDYDIKSSVIKDYQNIDKFLFRYYDLGHNGKIYYVIFSLKQNKIIDLSEVKNDSDKEYIYDLVLDNQHYYVSSLNTIKEVDGVIFRNYKEDKVVVERIKNENCIITFYDLIKGEKEEDHIEIPIDSVYSSIQISQWNEDGSVYFSSINGESDICISYKYNLQTKKLTTLGESIYFPYLTQDKKYIIYYYHQRNKSEKSSGIYALNIENETESLIYKPYQRCENLDMLTIMNY